LNSGGGQETELADIRIRLGAVSISGKDAIGDANILRFKTNKWEERGKGNS